MISVKVELTPETKARLEQFDVEFARECMRRAVKLYLSASYHAPKTKLHPSWKVEWDSKRKRFNIEV